MTPVEKEVLRECYVRLDGCYSLIAEMEYLLAKGVAVASRGERLGDKWQSHAMSVLRRLDEDAGELEEAE